MGFGGEVDGNVAFTCEGADSEDVVAVLVCDEDGFESVEGLSDFIDVLVEFFETESVVDENLGVVRDDEDGVSAASTSEEAKFEQDGVSCGCVGMVVGVSLSR